MKTLLILLMSVLMSSNSAFAAKTFCYQNLFCADVARIVDAEGGTDDGGLDPTIIEFENVKYSSAETVMVSEVEKKSPKPFFSRLHPAVICAKLVTANMPGAARNFITWDVNSTVNSTVQNGQERIKSFKCVFTNN